MKWSESKLLKFYDTSIGLIVKLSIEKAIAQIIHESGMLQPKVCVFGLNVLSMKTALANSASFQEKFDFIISIHCEETGHSMQEFTNFCQQHLRDEGCCILITPNGNGKWAARHTPFAKHRSSKNIKAIKRAGFAIKQKTPILWKPFITSKIIQWIYSYIAPSKAGAYIVAGMKTESNHVASE